MITFRNKLFAAAVFAATLAAIPGAAQAVEVRVHYYPYEMETPDGVGAVLARVERTVRRACVDDGTIGGRREAIACTNELTKQIVGKIDRAPLTALFVRRGATQVALNR